MKYRAVEILFRHKLLILLPVLLVVAATTALSVRPKQTQWQAFAGVWIDPYKPLAPDLTLTASGATSQAQLLNDFIRTRTFGESVLKQTQLAPLLDNPVTKGQAVAQFQRWVFAVANSTNSSFITIIATTTDPDLSYKLVRAVITSFQDTLQVQSDSQTQAASAVYQSSLQGAGTDLAKAQADLAAYINAHPELARTGSDTLRPTDRDPAYARLISDVGNAQQIYDGVQQRLQAIQQQAAAGRAGLPLSFTVVDKPELPLFPLGNRRLNLLKLPGIGLVVGLLLSSGLAALLVFTNRTVLGSPDIQAALGVPVLGELPQLRGYWWPWQRRPRGLSGGRSPWQRKPRQVVRLRLMAPARLRARNSEGM